MLGDAPGRFGGMTAAITGAAQGIGAATSRLLAREGANVVLLDLNQDILNEVLKDCNATGVNAVGFAGDVTDATFLQKSFELGFSAVGPIDILVNNAAVALEMKPGIFDRDAWIRLFEVNFLSAVHCTYIVAPVMATHGGGVIINVGSNHSSVGYPGWAGYASMKGALRSFTQQQAVELAPLGIRVVSLTPGATRTPLNAARIAGAADPAEFERDMLRGVPLARYAEPEEIASGIAFLASSDASYMTGADLRIDGGHLVFGS